MDIRAYPNFGLNTNLLYASKPKLGLELGLGLENGGDTNVGDRSQLDRNSLSNMIAMRWRT